MNYFLAGHSEKPDFNQYWYSQHTIDSLVAEVAAYQAPSVACVSTPSIYFSLPPELRAISKVLDFDRSFARDPGFVFYDFNNPLELPESLNRAFDIVVIDPPFITREVWEKYATTARFLLKEGGKLILSSIQENSGMLAELLGVSAVNFKPSIPHLVYQYSFFTNYEPTVLSRSNPEVPE
mmetsp:Transcript_9513/g.18411  ORF Transcript_9513/g.18411 Transcript_9513/m.18411 type:complete len:180 (+) Transcript_9513:2281-2820(+)